MERTNERPEGRNPGFYAPLTSKAGWRRLFSRVALALALVVSSGSLTSCVTTPVTGRSAFNLYTPEQDKELGAKAYQEAMAEARVNNNHPAYPMVKRVMDRLVAVADDPADFEWEVNMIEDDSIANAWCMPGGKMAVYTGILPYTQDETGLAVVMGHEIAHAVARHGTERISTAEFTSAASDLASKVLGGEANQAAVAGLANVLISLPYGRKQELESDHIGLIYMAKAGYDPRAAEAFWQRMSSGQSSGGTLDEFLSTHPSGEKRIEQIRELLPEALTYYQP